ncbi:MAG TPA: hypothetical protein VFV33_24110 [Gemmatimonadaceae bacterium]|nr:hypothetical protein [Gemmatimonadaceae bacterium]
MRARILPMIRRSAALLVAVVSLAYSRNADAQVRVNPTGVNVNTQGSTTVFLTYGGLAGYDAVEALWCGALINARPAVGQRCDPSTIFGSLPLRYTQAASSGTNALTDIMTIPASVTRRAYQAAADGKGSTFFYVRRFVSRGGGPDQYVAVTCRLAGGGARMPLALTDVQIELAGDVPLLTIPQGSEVPPFEARIAYTGTGRLAGRWEVVLPGEELPTDEDLLTEATLPREKRGTQRRYTQLGRFNVFLPPTGRVVLPGPDPSRLPSSVDGVYHVLLRVEATPDKEGDSNLGAVGAGTGIVTSGGVAGFPMPMLRYVVGSGDLAPIANALAREDVALVAPRAGAVVARDSSVTFAWAAAVSATLYRLELETSSGGALFTALVASPMASYRTPPFLSPRLAEAGSIRWRVVATNADGREVARSRWGSLRISAPQ